MRPPRPFPPDDSPEQVSLVLYEDPLSPWCLVAERRVTAAMEALSIDFTLRHAPFPQRVEPRAISSTERRRLALAARRAAREPEGIGVTPDLWLSTDPPLTSVPACTAIAAARLQGASHEAALREAIREAALVRGLNVARTDVLLELAERTGLDLGSFTRTFLSPTTEQQIRDTLLDAQDRGIQEAPALVIGDEWLVAGMRSAEDYRSILHRYATARFQAPRQRVLH